ncbi:MAG: RNA polymerase subunit sigma-70 [Acidobacteria bacterium 13_1_20CM_3_53_8]|nr:MAG: RNA polymerase subunit sigma-70 [Acidobacteria bacterium 13_1_20CM_3_53_8]
MAVASSNEVTQLLEEWSSGKREALDKLTPLVYEELRRLAHRYMNREQPGNTLQTTALVNEAYLRLVKRKNVRWQNRAHFFAVAAQVMRHILIDHAREHHYAKRGGDARKISLDQVTLMSPERAKELIALDEALEALARIDPRKSRIVELRYFGGMTIEEVAEVLKIAPVTVQREWRAAKAWLYKAVTSEDSF